MRLIALFLALAGLCACSDYNLAKQVEYAPEINVTPLEHDFGHLNADGQNEQIEVQITNIGNDTLELDDVFLYYGTENFTITTSRPPNLEPSESFTVLIDYDPLTYETNEDILRIYSNDEDEPITLVNLGGSGDAPIIDISPTFHDFEEVFLGCEDYVKVDVSNIGNVDLEISQVDYYASVPTDLFPLDYEVEVGEFPWIIPAGEVITLDVQFEPIDVTDDNGYFEVHSNDPVNPTTTAAQVGIGTFEKILHERFEQDGMMGSDILFVIDNSGSMCGNQAQLANNFDTFVNILSASGYDYQIAFITTDDERFVGPIITPSTPDPVAEAMSQIGSIGCSGSPMEKGMDMSMAATGTSGNAGPGSAFLRTDAKLVVIYLSDENDISVTTPSAMASRLWSLKSSDALAVAHAVAGDVPGGCTSNGGAQAGTDYFNLVNLMGGTYLSICAEDWGTPMEELARESLARNAFLLADKPIVSSISVEVDGVISVDWTYDAAMNAVVFSVLPRDGAFIDVRYATWACQEE